MTYCCVQLVSKHRDAQSLRTPIAHAFNFPIAHNVCGMFSTKKKVNLIINDKNK